MIVKEMSWMSAGLWGEGIPQGACDCDGNVPDECGVCGGSGATGGAIRCQKDCDCDGHPSMPVSVAAIPLYGVLIRVRIDVEAMDNGLCIGPAVARLIVCRSCQAEGTVWDVDQPALP